MGEESEFLKVWEDAGMDKNVTASASYVMTALKNAVIGVIGVNHCEHFVSDNLYLDILSAETIFFSDSMLLPTAYECLLIGESDNSSDKNAKMLKAEIAVFVQWMEDKLGLARRTIANKRMLRIWDKNKTFFNALFDQIDDEEEHALALRTMIWCNRLMLKNREYTKNGWGICTNVP
ncbi:hypothetical protein GPALN_010312 [Globodera pallida]|nr:hypothetical protein GPALN_010312 [Globodera pallida]